MRRGREIVIKSVKDSAKSVRRIQEVARQRRDHDLRPMSVDQLLDDTSIFFFSSRRRHTRCSRDWSSDVCSSDLRRGTGDARSSWLIHSVARQAEIGVVQHVEELGAELDLVSFTQVEALLQNKIHRSEERRVGKECRSRWSPYH